MSRRTRGFGRVDRRETHGRQFEFGCLEMSHIFFLYVTESWRTVSPRVKFFGRERSHARSPPPAPKGEDLIPWIPVSYRRARLSARSSTFPRLLERASKEVRPRVRGYTAVSLASARGCRSARQDGPSLAHGARRRQRVRREAPQEPPRVCLPSRNRGARSRTRPRRLPHSPFPDAPARSRAFEPLEEGFPHPGHAPNAKHPRSSSSLDSPAPSPPCSSRRVKARPPRV